MQVKKPEWLQPTAFPALHPFPLNSQTDSNRSPQNNASITAAGTNAHLPSTGPFEACTPDCEPQHTVRDLGIKGPLVACEISKENGLLNGTGTKGFAFKGLQDISVVGDPLCIPCPFPCGFRSSLPGS